MKRSIEDTSIVLVGAGNLATNLAKALYYKGFRIEQVYSRTPESARTLALAVEASWTTDLTRLVADAGLYIVSLKDDVLVSRLPEIVHGREHSLWVHTAGSIPMDIWQGHASQYGVFYPMQSFSKQIATDFTEVPFFIEAVNDGVALEIEALAQRLSQRVFHATSEQRRRLHIAAVFACNFANHLWTLADDVLRDAGLPFDVMLPLISTTVDKLKRLSPAESQTGPAMRRDHRVMQLHMAMLDKDKALIYKTLSDNIMKRHEQD